MRVCLAGLGGAGVRGHLPAFERLEAEGRLTLVAAADLDPGRRALLGARRHGLPLFDSVEAMLDRVESDVLVVATEPTAHATLIELGLRHGRHVVCEKPLAVTAEDYARIVAAARVAPAAAIVGLHQYRYSPTLAWLLPWVRTASRLQVPFSLIVDVRRQGLHDPCAVSPWRADPERSGGMFAEHGVHFLALGWAIAERLEVLGSGRYRRRAGGEHAYARLRLGSGVLELRMSAAAGRGTGVEVSVWGARVSWRDSRAALRVGRWDALRWRTSALSDRGHLDSLYLDFYADLVRNLGEPAWRAARTRESLDVGAALIDLLQCAPR